MGCTIIYESMSFKGDEKHQSHDQNVGFYGELMVVSMGSNGTFTICHGKSPSLVGKLTTMICKSTMVVNGGFWWLYYGRTLW